MGLCDMDVEKCVRRPLEEPLYPPGTRSRELAGFTDGLARTGHTTAARQVRALECELEHIGRLPESLSDHQIIGDEESIGHWIDRLQSEIGISSRGLSAQTGIDHSVFTRFRQGADNPSARLLATCLRGLRISPEAIGKSMLIIGGRERTQKGR